MAKEETLGYGKVLDLEEALEAINGKKELFKKMANVFYNDMPRQLETLRQLLIDEDMTLIKQQAHTIKGASASIRANLMVYAADQVDKAVKDGKQSEAWDFFQRLTTELEKVRKELERSGLLIKS